MKSTNEFLTELKGKSATELQTLLKEKRLEQFTLKMKLKTQQLTNSGEIKQVRRDIARILTILNDKEMSNA